MAKRFKNGRQLLSFSNYFSINLDSGRPKRNSTWKVTVDGGFALAFTISGGTYDLLKKGCYSSKFEKQRSSNLVFGWLSIVNDALIPLIAKSWFNLDY